MREAGKHKASLAGEEREEPVARTKALKAYTTGGETSSQEDGESPCSHTGEMTLEGAKPPGELRWRMGQVIHSSMFTSGIGYLKVLLMDRVLKGRPFLCGPPQVRPGICGCMGALQLLVICP